MRPKESVVRLRKVKLKLGAEQKRLLRQFETHARYTYNKTVEAVNGGATLNKMTLRNAFVTAKGNPWVEERSWLTQTPKAIRQQAVFEAVKNFKSAFSNKAKGNIDKFKMGYKKKGRHNAQRPWTLGIEKAVKRVGDRLYILPETIGEVRYYGKLPFDSPKPDAECSIHRDATGRYFLQVPIHVVPKTPKEHADKVVSLDPGVRKFVTGYSPSEGHGFCVGNRASTRVLKILRAIDQVNSSLSSPYVDCKQRRRLRQKKARLYVDYKNVRDDFHWKLTNMLTSRYDRILLPRLEIAKLSRGLTAKVSREMLAQSHGLFVQRLVDKCCERGTVVETPSERHTSKTCGLCGELTDVGSSETFACRAVGCGYVADRDLNAARNIYLRTDGYEAHHPNTN